MNVLSHQTELTWYLTQGIAYFEKSTFGAQLDAIVFRAFGSRPCTVCGGIGILDEPWIKTHREARDGTLVKLEKPEHIPTGKDCPECKGHGCVRKRFVRSGEAITCRPKTAGMGYNREAPPDEILTRYALVSRRLSLMPGTLSKALQAAYGDEGEANVTTTRGRSWAATPLTRAGKTLLERHRKTEQGNDNQFRAVLALTELAQLEASHSVPERKRLLTEASRQAINMVASAERSWERLEHMPRSKPIAKKIDREERAVIARAQLIALGWSPNA